MRSILLTLALMGSLVSSGCDRGDPPWPAPRDDGRTWHAEPPERRRPDGGLGRREFVPITLPEARHAITDRQDWGPRQRLVVNVQTDGQVVFRGMTYSVAGDDEARTQALDAMAQEVRDLLAGDRRQSDDAHARFPLLMHADRDVAWSDWSAVVLTWFGEGGFRGPLHISATHWAGEGSPDQRLDARFRPDANGPDTPDTAIPVRLMTTGIGEVLFSWVEEPGVIVFPIRPRRSDRDAWAQFVERANVRWTEVERAFPAGSRATGATLEVDADIPLDFVVTTIDLLLARGVRNIRFDVGSGGFRLVFRDVQSALQPLYEPPATRPALWWTLLGVTLAAVLPLIGLFGSRRVVRARAHRRR